jgi:hypothetical protein
LEARGLVLIAKLIALAGDDLAPGGQPILSADPRSILFLGAKDQGTSLDEAALLDAVAIYTRDLGVTVLRSNERRGALGGAPALTEIAQLLRSRSAALAFWCQVRAEGTAVELVVTDGRRYTIRDTFAQDSPGGPGIYRAIALKLRAALTGAGAPFPGAAASRDGGDRAAPRSSPAQSPSAAPAGSEGGPSGADDRARVEEVQGPTGAAVARMTPVPSGGDGGGASPPRAPTLTSSLAPSSAPSTSPSAAAAQGSPPERQVAVAVDYALSLPTGSAPWRNAAALHGIVSLRGTAEVDLGLELARAAEGAVPSGSVAVTDIPVRFGARLLRRTNAYLIAAGAIAGVHAFFARATSALPERATESTRTVAASFGVEVLARGPSIRGIAPELRLFGELNAPNTRFRVRGTTALEPGALTLGLGLGVIVPAP